MWDVADVLAAAVALLVAGASTDPIAGRWDITVDGKDGKYPSWVEFSPRDGGLEGRFVGRTGAVHDLRSIQFDGTEVKFVVPKEEEELPRDLAFRERSRMGGFTV